MDDVLTFRNKMAEAGIELTPAEAETKLFSYRKMTKALSNKAKSDPLFFDKLASLPLQEKRRLCSEFQKMGHKVTVPDLNHIIDLAVHVHERSKD